MTLNIKSVVLLVRYLVGRNREIHQFQRLKSNYVSQTNSFNTHHQTPMYRVLFTFNNSIFNDTYQIWLFDVINKTLLSINTVKVEKAASFWRGLLWIRTSCCRTASATQVRSEHTCLGVGRLNSPKLCF